MQDPEAAQAREWTTTHGANFSRGTDRGKGVDLSASRGEPLDFQDPDKAVLRVFAYGLESVHESPLEGPAGRLRKAVICMYLVDGTMEAYVSAKWPRLLSVLLCFIHATIVFHHCRSRGRRTRASCRVPSWLGSACRGMALGRGCTPPASATAPVLA